MLVAVRGGETRPPFRRWPRRLSGNDVSHILLRVRCLVEMPVVSRAVAVPVDVGLARRGGWSARIGRVGRLQKIVQSISANPCHRVQRDEGYRNRTTESVSHTLNFRDGGRRRRSRAAIGVGPSLRKHTHTG